MTSEKIRILMIKKGIKTSQLAEKLNTSRQNLNGKLKRDNFSEKELREIANALDVELEIFFTFPDGTRI